MKNLILSKAIQDKLAEKHDVTRREIEQCFENRYGDYLEDTREQHRTDPPTMWFISKTNKGRLLKVIFVFSNGNVFIKSAYEPEPEAIKIYDTKGRPSD
jgi:hypothetical protein